MKLMRNAAVLVGSSILFAGCFGISGSNNPEFGAGGVFMRHYNLSRTGANTHETLLTPANVKPGQFGKVFSLPTDGYTYAQPLYVPHVSIPNVGTYNVLYVATEGDSLYAFDAEGSSTVPLWKDSFVDGLDASANGTSPLTSTDTACPDVGPRIGITGTPVIDIESNTIYVVAATKMGTTSPQYFQHLHAIDLSTGAEKPNSPMLIEDPDFNPRIFNQRMGLVLSQGKIYVAWASHCDTGPYSGLMMSFDATTLKKIGKVSSTDPGNMGGLWSTGMAPAVDRAGNLYASTGNGLFDGNTNYGCSVLKITDTSGALTIADFFSPWDESTLNTYSVDLDVGSGGIMLLPDQGGAHPHLLVSVGKSGQVYVLDRDNLGQYDPNDKNFSKIVQSFNLNGQPYAQDTFQWGLFGTPAFFNGKMYIAPVKAPLAAYEIKDGVFTTTAVDQTQYSFNWPGGTPTVSANGTQDGIVWFVDTSRANNHDANGHPLYWPNNGEAILLAYDATNLAAGPLFNSDKTGPNGTGLQADVASSAVKHVSPTVIDGRVYVGTKGEIDVYGLKN